MILGTLLWGLVTSCLYSQESHHLKITKSNEQEFLQPPSTMLLLGIISGYEAGTDVIITGNSNPKDGTVLLFDDKRTYAVLHYTNGSIDGVQYLFVGEIIIKLNYDDKKLNTVRFSIGKHFTNMKIKDGKLWDGDIVSFQNKDGLLGYEIHQYSEGKKVKAIQPFEIYKATLNGKSAVEVNAVTKPHGGILP